MSDRSTVIDLDRVSKRYLLGEHHGTRADLRETMVRRFRRWRGQPAEAPELWSLKDVSLTVEEGTALGIVGTNGAGKSTLMRIVNGITAPTSGVCRTRGRIGSLLEVGAGFHGELTGLENTYLNGAILGMSRREVAPRLDEIVEFAGLRGFMDTPVKRYSSGMYLRLGFAIAAHMTADVLLVDEALAVGDGEFQRKCITRMNEVRENGCTVLFISHYMTQVSKLCSTVLWIERGQVRMLGPTGVVVDDYLRSLAPEPRRVGREPDPDSSAQIIGVALVDDAGTAQSALDEGETAWLEVDVLVNEALPDLDVFCQVETIGGVEVLNEGYGDAGGRRLDVPGTYRLRCRLPAILAAGDYRIGAWLGTPDQEIDIAYRVLGFTVVGDPDDRPRRVLRLAAEWRIARLNDHLRE